MEPFTIVLIVVGVVVMVGRHQHHQRLEERTHAIWQAGAAELGGKLGEPEPDRGVRYRIECELDGVPLRVEQYAGLETNGKPHVRVRAHAPELADVLLRIARKGALGWLTRVTVGREITVGDFAFDLEFHVAGATQ